MATHCEKCNQPVGPDQRFCTLCGHPVASIAPPRDSHRRGEPAAVAEESESGHETSAPRRRTRAVWVTAVLAVALVVGGGAGVLATRQSTGSRAVGTGPQPTSQPGVTQEPSAPATTVDSPSPTPSPTPSPSNSPTGPAGVRAALDSFFTAFQAGVRGQPDELRNVYEMLPSQTRQGLDFDRWAQGYVQTTDIYDWVFDEIEPTSDGYRVSLSWSSQQSVSPSCQHYSGYIDVVPGDASYLVGGWHVSASDC